MYSVSIGKNSRFYKKYNIFKNKYKMSLENIELDLNTVNV